MTPCFRKLYRPLQRSFHGLCAEHSTGRSCVSNMNARARVHTHTHTHTHYVRVSIILYVKSCAQ